MKQTIKKLMAFLTSIVMLSAIVGANTNSYTLSDYPAPLIKDAVFDGDIVYGENADPSDIMGLVDAVAEIAVIETEESIATAEEVVTIGEAYKIERNTDMLNLGEDIAYVGTKIDVDDLPTVLADGVYSNDKNKEFDYEQTLKLGNKDFTVFTDRDYEDDEPTIGLRYDDEELVMTYELSFISGAESDVDKDGNLEDFEDTSITMLGNTYDIVEATNQSGGYFEIMGGAVKDVLEQGQTKEYTISGKDYEVEVTFIGQSGGGDAVKFKVNGELTKVMAESDTFKLKDGTQLGVREILEEEAGEIMPDQVEFYIGAEKMTLENNEELQLNDEDIDDIRIIIYNTQDGLEYNLQSIKLQWITEDELFVTEEVSALMPGLESVKLNYEGLTTDAEEKIEIINDGEDTINLKIPVKGDEDGFEFAILYDDPLTPGGFNWLGDEDYKLLTTTTSTYNYDKNSDEMMVISNIKSFETHFLKVTDIDDEYGVDFKDVITGTNYLKKDVNETFEVADITFKVDVLNETLKTVSISATTSDFAGNVVYSLEGLMITLPDSATFIPSITVDIPIQEEADDLLGVTGTVFTITVESDQNAIIPIDANVKGITGATPIGEIGDTDEQLYYVLTGEVNTKIIKDEGPDQHTATIYYPGGESYGNLYVSETETSFTTTSGGTQKILKKVDIPLAMSDSDVLKADPLMNKKNYLLVGGPCANKATAKVLESTTSWPSCADGFEEGIGRIVLKESDGKVAIIVAGMTALDTTRATRVLEGYATKYTLEGTEVEVKGTTTTPDSVTVVKAEEETSS